MKISIWAGSIALLAAAVQLITFLLGMELDILTSGAARGVLLLLALVALIYVMALDRRSVADYGLVADRHWARYALGGLALGLIFYAGYCALATALGVFVVNTAGLTISHGGVAAFSALSALPVAVLTQILFSGYLPSTLRDRHSLVVAVLLPSLLFGVLGGVGSGDEGLASAAGSRLAFGLFMIAALLCTTRLTLGNLAFPAGLLAGAIMVRRVLRKTHLLAYQGDSDWAGWLAPAGDPRQGPVMWAALAAFLALACWVLHRKGEYQLSENQPALDASFKRVMPFSNLIGLAPLDLWIAKLWQARFHVGVKYIPRLVVTLIASTINTILTLPERLLAPLLLRHRVPDPVFIVGVHRSGTTHLHNMLSLDRRYCTPRNYQVFNPHGFLSGWLTTFVLGPFLTWKRPMDAVQLHVFSPQEEEFAIAAMCPQSPYWAACLPRLWPSHEQYIFPEQMAPSERTSWQRSVVLFLRKLTAWNARRPLLKSPYNTARVAALRQLFPNAKFIHITRHPHRVYRSNLHLAEHGWAVFQLQDDDQQHFAKAFLKNYRQQEDAFYRDSAQLPPSDVAEVRFEDLETDPVGEIRRLYQQLGLDFDARFAQRLESYLARIAGYRKNRFRPLPDDVREKIDAAMQPYLTKWGYTDSPSKTPRRAA